MKRVLHGIILAFIAVLIITQVKARANNAGVNVKPSRTELTGYGIYNQSYASMHLHTSVGQFYNLSTLSHQKIVNFSTSANSSDMTVDKTNGLITLGSNTAGVYLVTFHTSFKATEGAELSWYLKKNGTTIHETSREMTAGPERFPTFINVSGTSTALDITEYTTKIQTGVTNQTTLLNAVKMQDGRCIHIDEVSAQTTPAFVSNFKFGSVDSPKRIFTNAAAYAGHDTHIVKLSVLNTAFGRYTNISNVNRHYPDNGSSTLPEKINSLYNRSWNIPEPNRNYKDSSGIVTARIIHTEDGANGGYFEIDKLGLQDALNSLVIEISEIVTLSAGDNISLWIHTDTIGTEYFSHGQGVELTKISR